MKLQLLSGIALAAAAFSAVSFCNSRKSAPDRSQFGSTALADSGGAQAELAVATQPRNEKAA